MGDQLMNDTMAKVLTAVLGAMGTVMAAVVVALITKAREWVVSKIGEERYNQAMSVATGIYVQLEDKYRELGLEKAGEEKKKEMQKLLLEKFPALTQVELDAINKSVWLGFNEEIKKAVKIDE